jgi:hypothetical protein
MTTDVRRAVFVAIMGSEDCAEACEKLLRLPLKVGRRSVGLLPVASKLLPLLHGTRA